MRPQFGRAWTNIVSETSSKGIHKQDSNPAPLVKFTPGLLLVATDCFLSIRGSHDTVELPAEDFAQKMMKCLMTQSTAAMQTFLTDN